MSAYKRTWIINCVHAAHMYACEIAFTTVVLFIVSYSRLGVAHMPNQFVTILPEADVNSTSATPTPSVPCISNGTLLLAFRAF